VSNNSKYQIRIETPADVSGLQKTGAALDKTTASLKSTEAAAKAATKSVEELAKAEDKRRKQADGINDKINAREKSEQDRLKNERVFGDQSKQNAEHLASLTRETKGYTSATDRAASAKSRLLEGLKKASAAVPGLGILISAAKNPWTLIAAAIALAGSKLLAFRDEITKMEGRIKVFENLNDRVMRFSELINQAKIDQEAFLRSANQAKNAPESPEDMAARLGASIDRRFGAAKEKVGAEKSLALDVIARDEAQGRITPAQASAKRRDVEARFGKRTDDLDIAQAAEQGMVVRQAAKVSADAAERARGQLPGAESAVLELDQRLQDEKARLAQSREFAGIDESGRFTEGGRAAQIRSRLNFKGLTNAGPTERRKLEGELEALVAGITTRQATIGGLESQRGAAQDNVATLRGQITTLDQSSRNFNTQAGESAAGLASQIQLTGDLRAINAQRAAVQGQTDEAGTAQKLNQVSSGVRKATGNLDGAFSSLGEEISYLQSLSAAIARDVAELKRTRPVRPEQ
jgi:hypothetical protein